MGIFGGLIIFGNCNGDIENTAEIYSQRIETVIIYYYFSVVINMFWTQGNVLWQIWIFKITDTGLKNAVQMGMRLILLVTALQL